MNVIFIGKFFPKKILRTINYDSKGVIGMSNHNFEMSIINGLCLYDGIKLNCLSIPGVYSYPYNNKRLFTSSEKYSYHGAKVHSVGFCNLPILKEISGTIALAIKLLNVIKSTDGNRIDILVNTPDNRLLKALRIAKSLTRKQITQTVIIPDIPSMVTSMGKSNFIKTHILNYLNKRAMTLTSKSDGLVLLTEAMMDFIERPVKHVVMEGIVDINTMNQEEITTIPNKQVILYTGTLRKIFGVMNLVKAFQSLKQNNVELWICGSGDCKDAIEEVAKCDERIKFFGLVDSQTALRLQHQATILINPRTSEGEYTRYSFPSKTMEYLLSGRSVIANRLPGIPEEYYEYIYTPKDESISSMAECIEYVLEMDTKMRERKADAGRMFVINNKNSKIQTKRILEMIEAY